MHSFFYFFFFAQPSDLLCYSLIFFPRVSTDPIKLTVVFFLPTDRLEKSPPKPWNQKEMVLLDHTVQTNKLLSATPQITGPLNINIASKNISTFFVDVPYMFMC